MERCWFCEGRLEPCRLPLSAPGPHTVFRCPRCRSKLAGLAETLKRIAPTKEDDGDRGQ